LVEIYAVELCSIRDLRHLLQLLATALRLVRVWLP